MDIYNFDKTGFKMGIISTGIVVTSTEKRSSTRLVQLVIINGLASFRESIPKVRRFLHSSLSPANAISPTGFKAALYKEIG